MLFFYKYNTPKTGQILQIEERFLFAALVGLFVDVVVIVPKDGMYLGCVEGGPPAVFVVIDGAFAAHGVTDLMIIAALGHNAADCSDE